MFFDEKLQFPDGNEVLLKLINDISENGSCTLLQFPDGNEVYCKLHSTILFLAIMMLQFPDGNEVYCKDRSMARFRLAANVAVP